jgi:Tol biopolymer transport system component
MKFGFFSFPQWRPDGRAISLYGKDSQGRSGIHVIDVESGGVSPLVLTGENESVYSHRWSVDGRVLFYTKGEPRKSLSIYVHDQKTGRESVLPGSPDDAQYIDVSPDGKWLAFLNGGLEKKLSIMPTEGGVPRESHAFQVSGQFFITPAWSADGKYIYFSSRVNPGDEEWDMWRFSLEERQVQKIELNSVSFRHPSLHPDGRRMIFSTEKTNAVDSEVWMMENFLPMAKAQK